jgi:ABC-type transport system involved in multi-copper enzyme maturation permease subunit
MVPLFAALIIERDPYTFGDLLGLLQAWFQDAGGFLYVGLLVYILLVISRPNSVPTESKRTAKLTTTIMVSCVAIATLLYAGYIAVLINNIGIDLLNVKPPPDPTGYVKTVTPKFSLVGYAYEDIPDYIRPLVNPNFKDFPVYKRYPWQSLTLCLGGVLSFIGAVAPFVQGLAKLRFRRIWAITLLSIKEVIRNRLIILFLLILLTLLFPISWFSPPREQDELLMGVKWTSILMSVLMVFGAMLLASFAIPLDVKSQNIYTIVTKPVERFEIVLGRFLGYTSLFTAAILATSLVTLLTLVYSNPSEKSLEKTYKARVPVRGKLKYESRKGEFAGTDIGKEFNYRMYIGGDPRSTQRAVYSFVNPPRGLQSASGDSVPVEFSFDIYRLTKGEEDRGVDINVRVVTWQTGQAPPGPNEAGGNWKWTDADKEKRYRADALAELRKLPAYSTMDREDAAVSVLRVAEPDTPEWAVANTLAEKYGYFEFVGKEIFDFGTERLYVPAGIFRAAAQSSDGTRDYPEGSPRVAVYIHCTTTSQMLGMAEGDLYLLETEQPFEWNYIKSAFGVWCWVVLVIGLAVTLSTYLDAVVTLLAVGFLFIVGFMVQYIYEIGMNIGRGQVGPFQALNQLLNAKIPTAEVGDSPLEKTFDGIDFGVAWAFRRVINVLPDVSTFSWTNYVAEGFNVSVESLIMNFLVLAAYLFPWFLMSYYLIRGREVAA